MIIYNMIIICVMITYGYYQFDKFNFSNFMQLGKWSCLIHILCCANQHLPNSGATEIWTWKSGRCSRSRYVEICILIFFDSQFVSGGVPLFESLVEKWAIWAICFCQQPFQCAKVRALSEMSNPSILLWLKIRQVHLIKGFCGSFQAISSCWSASKRMHLEVSDKLFVGF